ncbi:TIGR03826 family flagellar region protein [Bacillus sp. FJAT-47783]|uniref:TIGR03826 family flagellar region protein n=1 Tax=Bacillus sp. FJAT-47783 TaxID=2922712 RepID=UPI001FADDFA1|nr:TIGR03826 family flagellar region protein [Bacillus sp. FJAT-47783]
MGELANCLKCNALFLKTKFRDVCEACYKKEENDYETVYNFLKRRENRRATLLEVVESTGVSEDLLLKFIRQRRLQLANFPNLGYPCEKCGKVIQEGKLCVTCTKELRTEIEKLQKYDEHEKTNKDKWSTYYANKTKNK